MGVTALTCANGSVTGAAADTCTVTLTEAAPTNGQVVTLSSNAVHVTVPPSVTVAAGASSASFTATVAAIYTPQTATLTASAAGVAQTYAITLTPPAPASLTCVTPSLTGPGSDACTLTLTAGAPWEGMTVSLSTSNGALLQVPSSVTVAAGAASATFTATTEGAYTNQTITITAKINGIAQTYAVSLTPPAPASLTCVTPSLTGPGSDACTLTLTAGAPWEGLAVSLSSSNSAVTVPPSVTVASGSATAAFTATATAVGTAQSATVTATADGSSASTALQLNAATPGLSLSSSTLNFGSVQLNTTTTQSVTLTSSGNVALTVNSVVITGSGFTVSGVSFPLTLSPNQTAMLTVSFDPATAGPASGALTISSNATAGGTATVSLSGTGQAPPTPSAVSCTNNSLTGATTDACTVALTSPASSGGLVVTLSSSNSALTVPASVTVAGGSASVAFTATATAVSTAQAATVTATADSGSASTTLQLAAYVSTLTVNSSIIAFGDVDLNSPATQSLMLTSSGTAPVTVSSGSLTGTGFSMSGVSFPLTLEANQTATLEVSFDPTAAGTASGAIALASNCSMGPMTVSLSGTGVPPAYSVDLSWQAPASGNDPVQTYNVYRAVSGSNSYTLLGSVPVGTTVYTDTTVSNSTTYVYYVASVDADGNSSAPSNAYTATIP